MKGTLPLELSSGLLQPEESKIKYEKTSTLKTIISMTNNIVGSTILILPNLNMNCGIFTVQGVSILIGLITCHTCDMFISHLRDDEQDIPEVIKRVLGKKWANAFAVVSGIANIVFCLSYFLLMCNMFYPICTFVLTLCGSNSFAPKFEVTFSTFSFQYAAIIASLPCIFMVFLKDINIIMKFAQFGVVPMVSFILFVIYIVFDNLAAGRIDVSNMNLYTWDIHEVAGIFAIAYYFHTAACPVAKSNHKPENNSRDLFLSYLNAWIIYGFIGCFGYIGVMGRPFSRANNIMDFFGNDSIFAFIIQIVFFLKLCSVYPILCYAGRTQLLTIFQKNGLEVPQWKGYIYNIVVLSLSLAVALPCADPSVIISFNGAITGFILIYIFPIKMHVQCILDFKSLKEQSELTRDQEVIPHDHGGNIVNLL